MPPKKRPVPTSDGELQYVDPTDLVLCPQRRELDETELGDLKTAEYSEQRPIIVQSRKDGQFEVLDGWRTALLAIKKGITHVPIWNVGTLTEEEGLVRILREELPRRNANPIFLLFAIRRLRELRPGLDSDRKLADFLGASRTTVQRAAKLDSLSPALLEQLRAGSLKRTTAYQVARLDDHDEQRRVAQQAEENRWQHDRVREAVAAKLHVKRPARPFVETPSTVVEADALAEALKQTRPTYQAWPPIRSFLTGLIATLDEAEKARVKAELRELGTDNSNNPFAGMTVRHDR